MTINLDFCEALCTACSGVNLNVENCLGINMGFCESEEDLSPHIINPSPSLPLFNVHNWTFKLWKPLY